MFVRVAPDQVGRLVRVLLTDVDEHKRSLAARALRERLWRQELDPTRFDVPSTMRERLKVLNASIELQRAASFPSSHGYLIPEAAVARAGKNGTLDLTEYEL